MQQQRQYQVRTGPLINEGTFSPEMVQGYQPDRPRNFRGNQTGQTILGSVPIPAAFDQGYQPDRPRIFRGEQSGVSVFGVVNPPGVFSVDEIIATRPERPRQFQAVRIPMHIGELTTILAPFSIESIFAIRPEKPRIFLASKIPQPVGETATIGTPLVGAEMTFSSRPERQAGRLAAKIPLPLFPPIVPPIPTSQQSPSTQHFTPPVPTLDQIDPIVGWHVKHAIDDIVQRVNQLRFLNRSLAGDLVLQMPPAGSGSTQMFNRDRMQVNRDGSQELYGAIGIPARKIFTTTNIQATDFTVLADATNGNIIVYLPQAITCIGRIYTVKKIDGSVNTVTIDGNGSETIDGALTIVLGTQWSSKILQTDGLSWYVIGTV